jgi:hypothetical protein
MEERAMAQEVWVTVGTKVCDYIEMTVEMRELRLYPAESMPAATDAAYRVVQRQCTGAIACNMAGVPCTWAYNNPGMDKFHLS